MLESWQILASGFGMQHVVRSTAKDKPTPRIPFKIGPVIGVSVVNHCQGLKLEAVCLLSCEVKGVTITRPCGDKALELLLESDELGMPRMW
jgi:hypothetical protein